MRRKLLFLIMSIFILSGCAPIILGTGIVSGYLLSNDSAAGEISCDYRSLWDASLAVIKKIPQREIIEANESKGRIKVKASGIDLVIKINSLDEKKQYLKVAARKYLLPKPYYAQKIFFKIIKELE